MKKSVRHTRQSEAALGVRARTEEEAIETLLRPWAAVAEHQRDDLIAVLFESSNNHERRAMFATLSKEVRRRGGLALRGDCADRRAFGAFIPIVEQALAFLAEARRSETSLTSEIDISGLGCDAGCHSLWFQHPETRLKSEKHTPTFAHSDLRSALKPNTDSAPISRIRFFEGLRRLLANVQQRARTLGLGDPVLIVDAVEAADAETWELIDDLLRAGEDWPGRKAALSGLLVLGGSEDAAISNKALDALSSYEDSAHIIAPPMDENRIRGFLQRDDVVASFVAQAQADYASLEHAVFASPPSPTIYVREQLLQLSLTEGSGPGPRNVIEALALLGGRHSIRSLFAVLANEEYDDAEIAKGASRLAEAFKGNPLVQLVPATGGIDHALSHIPASAIEPSGEDRLIEFRNKIYAHEVCSTLDESKKRNYWKRIAKRMVRSEYALKANKPQLAIQVALREAAELARCHAHRQAMVVLARVEPLARDEAKKEIGIRLAEYSKIVGDYRQARERLALMISEQHEEIESLKGNAKLEATQELHLLRVRHAQSIMLSGQIKTAITKIDRLLADVSPGTLEEKEAFALRAEAALQHYDLDLAERFSTKAIESSAEDITLYLYARNTQGKLALLRGEYDLAHEIFADELRVSRKHANARYEARAMVNLGLIEYYNNQWDDAEKRFLRARDLASRAAGAKETAIATENLGVLFHQRRNYAAALAAYHEAIDWLKKLGNRSLLTRAACNLAELYLTLGGGSHARAIAQMAMTFGGLDQFFGTSATEHPSNESSDAQEEALERDTTLSTERRIELTLLAAHLELLDGHTESAKRILDEVSLDDLMPIAPQRLSYHLSQAKVALDEGRVEDVAQALSQYATLRHGDEPLRTWLLANRDLVQPDDVRWVVLQAENAILGGKPEMLIAKDAVTLADHLDDPDLRIQSRLAFGKHWMVDGESDRASEVLQEVNLIETQLQASVPEKLVVEFRVRPLRRQISEFAEEVRQALLRSHTRGSRVSKLPSAGIESNAMGLVGDSASTQQLRSRIKRIAESEANVLILGESGTGKELVANALHIESTRSSEPFVTLNCAAFVDSLLASELFGHERGAFTGADRQKKGRFELADGGTIFLDEIGDISPKMQASLLRVLQEGTFHRVGGSQAISTNVRIIAATHRNLAAMVQDGEFREDLYYRLNGVKLQTSPLRTRQEDITPIAKHVLDRLAREESIQAPVLSRSAMRYLEEQPWPGNVRQLENVLRRALLFAENREISMEDILEAMDSPPQAANMNAAASIQNTTTNTPTIVEHQSGQTDQLASPFETCSPAAAWNELEAGNTDIGTLKKAWEKELLWKALEKNDWNITRSARVLGITRGRASQLVKDYKLKQLKEDLEE